MKTCILIPVYNHGDTIHLLLDQLSVYHLPCIVIDDGSDEDTKQQLSRMKKKFWFCYFALIT